MVAGSVLLQSDDKDIPLAIFFKYKECLALTLAIQCFDMYISSLSIPTVLCIDHNPLVFLHKLKIKNRTSLNWSLILQEYSLHIEHAKGKDTICADTLSGCFT